jgi:hypothetical protein
MAWHGDCTMGCERRSFPRTKVIDCFANQCAYCRSSIASGQKWVREKIYDPALSSCDSSYLWYHGEPLEGQQGSCWEKHEMEREVLRTAAA